MVGDYLIKCYPIDKGFISGISSIFNVREEDALHSVCLIAHDVLEKYVSETEREVIVDDKENMR